MFTLVGYQSSFTSAALAPITPIPDGTVAVITNDIRIPPELTNIMAVAGQINSALATPRIQITTPSLRSLLPFDVSPIDNGLTWLSEFQIVPAFASPLPLVGLEPMEALATNGAAVLNTALVWLCDGPAKATTGKIYSVRATGTAATAVATWMNSNALVFANSLPTGTYQIVGFRAISANMVASRIFVPGYSWRPGVLGLISENVISPPYFRFGYMGVFATFQNTVPPTVEVLGVTDTAQTFYFDLIKTA